MSNLFSEFLSMIPKEAITIATLDVVNGDGSAMATSLDGNPMKVVGAGGFTVGQKVIVQGQAIISEAPSIAVTTVYI